jgi:signal transduction histidine kinase
VVIEARERVLALRQPTNDDDLPALLRAIAEESMLAPATQVTLVVEGEPRILRPDAAAEIAAVVSEALFNVARHAMARRTDIVAIFTRRRLTIRVHDDGAGIPPEILDRGGKAGHFGLAGMRERIERLSGRLTVGSTTGNGTTVTLDLPGHIVFRAAPRFPVSRWLERLHR